MENNQTDKEWNEYRQRTSEGWFQLQPEHKREIEKQLTDRMREQINKNTQTKTRWSDTERWIAAVIATLGTFGFIYWLYTIGYLIHFGIYTFLTWLVIMIVFIVKHLIDDLIDGR